MEFIKDDFTELWVIVNKIYKRKSRDEFWGGGRGDKNCN